MKPKVSRSMLHGAAALTIHSFLSSCGPSAATDVTPSDEPSQMSSAVNPSSTASPAEVSNTFDRVAAVISEILGVQQSQIIPSHDLYKDLGADSLDAVEIVMTIEEEFDVEIADEAAENMTTVGDIVRYLNAITQR